MPSFVSEDYSFLFEVRLLAQRGTSEKQPRGGPHTSPRAACHLGGKYVCMQRKKEGERQQGASEENAAAYHII